MVEAYSVVYNNASPLQSWRAGFREGVKMTLDRGKRQEIVNPKKQLGKRNYQRLLMWCSVGSDIENGLWSIYGARLGCYMTNCTDWDYVQVRDFEYLNQLFENNSKACNENLLQLRVKELGDIIRSKLSLPVADLDNTQSLFFKDVWTNPPRTNLALTEKEVTWDIIDL
jgi:hypothetical protein